MNEETLLDALNRVSYENAVLTIENSAYCAENAELRAAVAWESQRVDALHLAAANDEADMKELRAENAALRARLDKCCAELLVDAEGR